MFHLDTCLTLCNAVFTDGCNPVVYQGKNWPETDLSASASASCPCSEYAGSLAGRQYRKCEGTYSQKARWSNMVDVSECTALNDERTTGLLCQLAQVRRTYPYSTYLSESCTSTLNKISMFSL